MDRTGRWAAPPCCERPPYYDPAPPPRARGEQRSCPYDRWNH
ncbi:hypothetical protein [Azospirillum argentinense]